MSLEILYGRCIDVLGVCGRGGHQSLVCLIFVTWKCCALEILVIFICACSFFVCMRVLLAFGESPTKQRKRGEKGLKAFNLIQLVISFAHGSNREIYI